MTKKTESVENPNHIENGLTLTEIQIWPVRDAQSSRIKAMVTLTFNDCLRVNGCRLIEGAKGMFVSFPSEKKQGTDEWVSFVHSITRQGSNKIQELTVARYQALVGVFA